VEYQRQRELPYNMYVMAAWAGNRVIHLPSQNNQIDQMNPAYRFAVWRSSALCGQRWQFGVVRHVFKWMRAGGRIHSSLCQLRERLWVKFASVAQSLVPYPQFSKIFNNFEGFGTTYYQSIQVEVDKRFTNGLSFLAGYTLSHLMDNTSSGFSSFTSGGINKYNQKPGMGCLRTRTNRRPSKPAEPTNCRLVPASDSSTTIC
jgi:hypothetical protein